jgi:hypothetical protein
VNHVASDLILFDSGEAMMTAGSKTCATPSKYVSPLKVSLTGTDWAKIAVPAFDCFLESAWFYLGHVATL